MAGLSITIYLISDFKILSSLEATLLPEKMVIGNVQFKFGQSFFDYVKLQLFFMLSFYVWL
jgi:hypothetical protein